MSIVNGKLLEVYLSQGICRVAELPKEVFHSYVGGYGLGVKLLLERMDPATDALGPGNILGMAPGLLTGAGAVAADRYMVFGKSPSTGGWGDSNSGGYFGRELKKAGFDAILFFEQASKPVYLHVEDGEAGLLDADFLWGKDCCETDDLLKKAHGEKCRVSCIGPAGENLSMIAGISTDKGRMAARSALGAVMGSKKLKAVAVKGTADFAVADPSVFKAERKAQAKTIRESPFGRGLSAHGTAMFHESCIEVGDAPIRNWAGTKSTLKSGDVVSERTMAPFKKRKYHCSGCVIGCGGHERVQDGEFKTREEVHKVEYESMGMLGSNLLNESPECMIFLNDLCNRYGMDSIGCGGLCGYAMECFEHGYITTEDTDGLELRWGDGKAIVRLAEQIGKGEGVGAVLSKGFEHAIGVFGADTRQFAMAVRNEALPAHDPRWSAGLALTYYSNPTPARHTQGSVTFSVAGCEQTEMDGGERNGRAKHHKDNEILVHALSSAGLCTFCYSIIDYRRLVEVLSAADGEAWTVDAFYEAGRRISVLRHLFNLKAGIRFTDFAFPRRVLGDPPLQEGPTAGASIDLDLLVREYLQEMGFGPQSCAPSEELLEELSISCFA